MKPDASTLATRWQCSTRTVRRLLDAGLLEHIRITRNHVLIPETAVEEYESKRLVERRTKNRGAR